MLLCELGKSRYCMRHATSLLYHLQAVASRNKWFNSCRTGGNLTLWTPLVSKIIWPPLEPISGYATGVSQLREEIFLFNILIAKSLKWLYSTKQKLHHWIRWHSATGLEFGRCRVQIPVPTNLAGLLSWLPSVMKENAGLDFHHHDQSIWPLFIKFINHKI